MPIEHAHCIVYIVVYCYIVLWNCFDCIKVLVHVYSMRLIANVFCKGKGSTAQITLTPIRLRDD